MESTRIWMIQTLASLGPDAAPIAYAGFLALYITACLPCEPIDFLPGFLFGWVRGAIVSIVGKLVGLALSMGIGRYLFREKIQSFIFHRFPVIRKITIAIAQEGFWAIVLVRGLAIPAAVKNYGISACLDVSLVQNVLASAIIVVPHSIVWAWLGDSASTISSNFNEVDTSTLIKQVMPDPMVTVAIFLPVAIFALGIMRNVAKRVNFDKLGDENGKVD